MVSTLKNQRGQSIVEAVLILVIVLGIAMGISAAFRQNELLSSMVSGPWQRLSGLLQNGSWVPPNQGMAYHPNNFNRHISYRGDSPQ